MPTLTSLLGNTRPGPAAAGLGAAAVAATLVFTLNGMTAAHAYEDEMVSPQIVVAADARDEVPSSTVAFRTVAASRSEVREELEAADPEEALTDALTDEVPEVAGPPIETAVDGEFLTVLVTPAPEWCTFTGLGHIPETSPLCTNPSNNTPEQNRALGEYLTAQRGFTGDQWVCMDNLMTRESRWRHNAANPVSAARGIPQKMMSVHYGAGWRDSPTANAWMNDPEAQIEWGLDYIQRRYTTPCGAWSFFQANGWY